MKWQEWGFFSFSLFFSEYLTQSGSFTLWERIHTGFLKLGYFFKKTVEADLFADITLDLNIFPHLSPRQWVGLALFVILT